jgi:hypothetical protein
MLGALAYRVLADPLDAVQCRPMMHVPTPLTAGDVQGVSWTAPAGILRPFSNQVCAEDIDACSEPPDHTDVHIPSPLGNSCQGPITPLHKAAPLHLQQQMTQAQAM